MCKRAMAFGRAILPMLVALALYSASHTGAQVQPETDPEKIAQSKEVWAHRVFIQKLWGLQRQIWALSLCIAKPTNLI